MNKEKYQNCVCVFFISYGRWSLVVMSEKISCDLRFEMKSIPKL